MNEVEIQLDTAQQIINMLAEAAIRVINETRLNAPASTATPRVRRTKAEIAAAAAVAAVTTAPASELGAALATAIKAADEAKAEAKQTPAPAAPIAAAVAADHAALRAKLIAAVRNCLAANGEEETITRLGHPNISSVPNEELQTVIDRVSA